MKEQDIKNSPQIKLLDHVLQVEKRMGSHDAEAAYKRVQKRINQKVKQLWLKRTATIAALLLLSILISRFVPSSLNGVETQYITLQSNMGMRSNFNLPDGTIVHLNSGSSLTYPIPFNNKQRNVTLTGEAYFKVEKSDENPFIVSVAQNKMRVKVYGTKFNVQAFDSEPNVYTTLVDGSVAVELKSESGEYKEFKLHPSERATFNLTNNKLNVEIVNPAHEIAWIDGVLIFKRTPMTDVLRDLSNFYNVQFDLEEYKELKNYSFSGTFNNKQLTQVLDYIKLSSDIKYVIQEKFKDDSLEVNYTTIKLLKK